MINDIYKILIAESIEEYEEKNGAIIELLPKPNYSVKQEYLEAGEKRRKEIIEKDPDSFDGGGDRRTKEEKKWQLGVSSLPVGSWSALHEECIQCHTRKRRHVGHGLCTTCYSREKKKKAEKITPVPMSNQDAMIFCQNAACTHGMFKRKEGIIKGKFIFCSQECLDFFNSAGKEIEEEYSLTNSFPQMKR